MANGGPEPVAHLAAFDATGDVNAIWALGPEPADLVHRDGWLVYRPPGQLLPRDAPIARLEPQRGAGGTVDLVVDGANLILSGVRVRPGSPIVLADGDTLAIDPRDIGEPARAVLGGILVRIPARPSRPLRALVEVGPRSVDVERPGAGRGLLHGGLALAALGALPSAAAALSRPVGSRSREILVFAALGIGVLAATAISLSRLLALSGMRLDWDRESLARTFTGGFRGRSERWNASDVEGLRVRLRRSDDGRFHLAPFLRAGGATVALERGRHLAVDPAAGLVGISSLEARRLDWLEVGARVARTLGRSPDALVSAATDPAWPPERARAALAHERLSIP